jgi:hypothetical protein
VKHIKVTRKVGKKNVVVAVCGAEGPINEYVEAALASDCDECRVAIGIAQVGAGVWNNEKKKVGVHPEPTWDAQPMTNADEILAYVAARRQ